MAEEVSPSPQVMARHDQLETFCNRMLQRLGVPPEEADGIPLHPKVAGELRAIGKDLGV